MMNPNEKIIQISARAGSSSYMPVLYALTNLGNIYIRIDRKWDKLELPNEQEKRLEEETKSPKKKRWFS